MNSLLSLSERGIDKTCLKQYGLPDCCYFSLCLRRRYRGGMIEYTSYSSIDSPPFCREDLNRVECLLSVVDDLKVYVGETKQVFLRFEKTTDRKQRELGRQEWRYTDEVRISFQHVSCSWIRLIMQLLDIISAMDDQRCQSSLGHDVIAYCYSAFFAFRAWSIFSNSFRCHSNSLTLRLNSRKFCCPILITSSILEGTICWKRVDVVDIIRMITIANVLFVC